MGRYKCQVNMKRDRGVTGKQDTPVKPAPSRRNKFRKLPPIKQPEAIPEEPDQNVPTVRSAPPALMSSKTIGSESALKSSSVTSKGNTSSPAAPALVSPAAHPTTQTTLNPKALTPGTTPAQETSARPESVTSSSMESDVTFSSDDDEDDSSSSSLPSPEIFRGEIYVETEMENYPGHHPYMKNSTLLDVSHAEGIHMCHPPNLSTIIDVSSILYEKKAEINPILRPEVETKLKAMSLKPVKSSLNSGTKTPSEPNTRRPISYRKKVWFKSPIISETFDAKCTPAEYITSPAAAQPATTEEKKPDVDTPRAGESSFKKESSGLVVSLKRPETAKFFDFETESDENSFFQMMRERSDRLRSLTLFPLAAVKHTNTCNVRQRTLFLS